MFITRDILTPKGMLDFGPVVAWIVILFMMLVYVIFSPLFVKICQELFRVIEPPVSKIRYMRQLLNYAVWPPLFGMLFLVIIVVVTLLGFPAHLSWILIVSLQLASPFWVGNLWAIYFNRINVGLNGHFAQDREQ